MNTKQLVLVAVMLIATGSLHAQDVYKRQRLREVMLKRMEEDDEKHYHRK